jgi:hypothetical protein
MSSLRRKNPIVSRRRVEDEGEEEGGPDTIDLEDDSLSEGSVISDDDDDAGDGSETSRMDELPVLPKSDTNGQTAPTNGDINGSKATATELKPDQGPKLVNGTNDTEMMMNGLKISDQNGTVEEAHYDDMHDQQAAVAVGEPAVSKSSAQMDQLPDTPLERRRREHEEYKKKRDADPAFVPNRGAFFMHDHRHAGPAANGFRPFGRGRGRGGRGGIRGPFVPIKYVKETRSVKSIGTNFVAVMSLKQASLQIHLGRTTCTKQ